MEDDQNTQTYANDSATSSSIDTPLAQWCSPTVHTIEYVGFTYFIRAGASIKIGAATDFKKRLTALQTAHERPLEVLAVVPASAAPEYEVHQQFAHLRLRGEWFRADRELLQFIEGLVAAHEPARVRLKPTTAREVTLVEKLHALRRAHGVTSAVGYHCSNLTELIPNFQASTDPDHRAGLALSIKRQMAGLARLRADLQ